MNKRNVIITIISVLILMCLFAFARTTTTDLGLVKPTWTETVDILDDINANSDLLEAFANDPLEFDTGERLEDRAGAMWTGNTETGLTITYQDADNTIDAVIGADNIVESMLKAVNAPLDEEIFTYESTTGDFEWHTLAELSIQPLDATLTALAGLTITANSLVYGTGADAFAVLATNATATNKFLREVSSGAPAWATLVAGDIPDISATYQPLDTALTNISALVYVSPSFIKLTADDTYAVRTLAETLSDIGAQASDASLTSIAGLTYASPSFIKVTAEDTYAIRTFAEVKQDLNLEIDIDIQQDITNIILCSNYDHPDDAITAIASANKTLLVTEAETCDVNFTVPANVTVRFERGGKWTINTGVTVTFNGQIDAGLWQIFAYTGTGTLAGTPLVKEVYPQWWGALANGSNDDTTAIQNAVDFTRDTVVFSEGTYIVSSEITLKSNLKLLGISLNSIIKLKDNTVTYLLRPSSMTNITIKNLTFDGNKANQSSVGADLCSGIRFDTVTYSTIADCKIKDFNGNGIYLTVSSDNVKIINNFIDDCGTDSIVSKGDGITICNSDYVLVEGNHVESCERWSIVLSGVTSLYCSVTGNVLISDNNNALGCMDLEWANYSTISNNILYDTNLNASNGTLTIWGIYNVIDSNVIYASTSFAISVCDSYNTISNNITKDAEIYVAEALVGVTVINNKVYNTSTGIVFDRYNEDFICNSNTVDTTSSYGIRIYEGKRGEVCNNNVKAATNYGIYLQVCSYVTCTGNIVSNTSGIGYAIYITSAHQINANDNIFYNNSSDIVLLSSGSVYDSGYFWQTPDKGTWYRGAVIWDNNLTASGSPPGWYCTTSGTFGTLNSGNTTGDTVTGENILIPNSLTGLKEDVYLNVAGAYAAKYITDMITTLASTTVDAASGASEANPKLLNVTATTNFAVGETIIIDRGTGNEIGVIASIQAGVSLTLVDDMTGDYTNETVENCVLMSANATGTVDDVAVSYHTPIFQNMAELGLDLDDTAGNGDTDKLWSADKIFDQLALKATATEVLTLLSTTTIAFNADADTTLYTVPTGKRCVLSHAIIVAAGDAGATTTVSIGANGAETDFIPANTLSNLDAQYDSVILQPIPNTTPLKIKSYAAATVIEAQVASQSGAAGNTIYLFGILY